MARVTKTVTTVNDDLTGEIIEGEAHTVSFIIDGEGMTLDLSDESVQKFRDAISEFTQDWDWKPMTVTQARAARKSKFAPGYLKSVREWAVENGIEVAEKGLVAKSVIEQYEASKK